MFALKFFSNQKVNLSFSLRLCNTTEYGLNLCPRNLNYIVLIAIDIHVKQNISTFKLLRNKFGLNLVILINYRADKGGFDLNII